MERCSLLNGNIVNQDSDYSAPLLALTDGWVIEGLEVSHIDGNNFEVSSGNCLVKGVKTNGDKVLVHFQSTEIKQISLAWPKKVWVEINQQNLDNPLLNPITGLGIGQIKYGDTYPSKNYVALASVNASNEVTNEQLVIKNINTVINHAIAQIQIGATTFSATSSWPSNIYNIEYAWPIPTNVEDDPMSIPQNILLYFKAHQPNTSNIQVSVNTSAWTLTAPLKKMLDRDLDAGDIKADQRVIMQRDGDQFQMQSQIAQVPVGTVQNMAIQWQVGEEVSVGQIGFVGRWTVDKMRIEQLDGSWLYNVWDGTNIKLRAMLITGRDNILRKVTVNLGKVWWPSDQIYCRIYASNGTTLIASSSNYYDNTSISSSNEQKNFLFGDLILQPQSKYYISFERTWGNNTTNYYTLRASWTQFIYPMAYIEKFNGSQWEFMSGHIRLSVQMGFNHELSKRYPSQPEYESTASMDWVFTQNKLKDEVCEIVQDGTANSFLALTPGNNYYLNNIDSWNKNLSRNTSTHFGYQVENQEKLCMSFKLSYAINTDRIFLWFAKVNTPTDNIVVSIQTDDNGKPSWTLVHPNATFNVSGSTLMSQFYKRLYLFNWFFNLKDSTVYWIVLERDGGLNTSHYYTVLIYNSDVYSRGNMMTYINSKWTTQTWDMFFSFTNEYDGIRQHVYNENRNFGNSNGWSVVACQSFHGVSPMTIKSIMLAIWQISSPNDGIRIRIEKNFAQIPGASWYQNTNRNGVDQIFGSTTVVKYAQSFVGSEYLETWLITFYMKKNNVPTDTMTVRIETDDWWSPSGTLINSNAQTTMAPASMSAWRDWMTLQFPGSVKMDKNTKYWIVLTRSGAVNAVHNYSIGIYNANVYAQWDNKSFDGTTWTTVNNDIMFRFGNTDFMVDTPSGDLAHPNAEIIVPVAQLSTGVRNQSFDFPWSFVLDKNTKYWIVLSRTGSQFNNGYYQFAVNNNWAFMYGHYLETGTWAFYISGVENRSLFFNLGLLYERPKGVVNTQIPSFLNRCTFVGKALSLTNLAIKNWRMVGDNSKIMRVDWWTNHSVNCTSCNTEVWWSVFSVGIGNMRFEVWGWGNWSTTGRLYMADDEQTLLNGWWTQIQSLTTGNITFLANPTKKYRIRVNGATTCWSWCSASHYAQVTFEPFAGSLIV